MTDSVQLMEALDAGVRRRDERRAFFRTAMGAAAVGVGALAMAGRASAQAVTEADVLNFALNLEYLEANFYSYAVFGTPLSSDMTGGSGKMGAATGGRKVNFTDPAVAAYAREIAQDEINHVKFLRTALGSSNAVGQPQIDVGIDPNGAFSNAARAAKLIADAGKNADGSAKPQTSSFDAYANDENFLLAAFIFEDVGVTAYKGSSGLLINNKVYVDAAAGILAAEAYHASIIRTTLDQKGIAAPDLVSGTEAISGARDSLDGTSDLDQGIKHSTTSLGDTSNIVPTDSNGLAFSRSAQQVLNVVYLNNAAVTMGGFFPAGVNGNIATSANNAG